MSEPVLDLSELVGMYKADARKAVQQMRAALSRWDEVVTGGPASQELRKLSHQLRGSGTTYGFRGVSRVGKALEHLMIKLQAHRLTDMERLRTTVTRNIDRLAAIFKQP